MTRRRNQAASGSRASNGPQTTVMSTYAVASGAISGSTAAEVAARPAITMENSPRGVSVSPARHRPGTAMPARVAAR